LAPALQNGAVLALATYNSALVAGGSFSAAGAVNASAVALWDGTAWFALGDDGGIASVSDVAHVRALAVY